MNEPAKNSFSRARGHQQYQQFASFFSRLYSTALNPLYHLGRIAIFLFVIALVSGIYLFLFYNVDPRHAYDSVEKISSSYVHGWGRSVHRYASDLLIIFILLHLLHMLITGKFRRLLSWTSGVLSFLVVLFIGVTGFILVWDQKAKLIGFLTAKFFSGLPLFDPAVAGAFLLNDLEYIGGFFRVALFGHIFFSVLTVIILWIHVMKISKPVIFPPLQLMLYVFIALAFTSLLFPVISDAPAHQSFLPVATTFDWYYFFGYYFLHLFSVKANWVILFGSGLFLALLPYMLKGKLSPPATVDLEKCNACNLCAYDCPYNAIDMLIYEGKRKAILNPARCVGCGICIGSCQEHAISLPGFPVIETKKPEQKIDLTVFSCTGFNKVTIPAGIRYEQYSVPCIGSVLTKEVEEIAQYRSSGVALLGCEDCYYRKGKTWTWLRFLRKRPPMFSKKNNRNNIWLFSPSQYRPERINELLESLAAIQPNEPADKFHSYDNVKQHPVPATLLMTAFFLLMIPWSSTRVRYFNPNEKILVVNMKYVSSPTVYENISSSEKHMQSTTPAIKKRSPVKLEISDAKDKSILYEKIFMPRGLRQDIAMFIYAEMKLRKDSVTISLTETAFPEKRLLLEHVALKKGDGTFILLKEGKLIQATLENVKGKE